MAILKVVTISFGSSRFPAASQATFRKINQAQFEHLAHLAVKDQLRRAETRLQREAEFQVNMG
jgi:hypothetical protein